MSSENENSYRRSLRLRYKTTEILFDPNAEEKPELDYEEETSKSIDSM